MTSVRGSLRYPALCLLLAACVARGGDVVPFDGTMERTQWDASPDSVAVLDSVRHANRDGHVRVVFQFRDQLPAGFVGYLDESPIQCGSGEPAQVAGSAWLEVRMTPARAHEFVGERAEVTVQDRNVMVNGAVLKQLRLTCDFEANLTWVLGVDARRPYRVLRLTDPPRVVVDVGTSAP